MKMTASTRGVGGVTIVDLSGRIVLGEGSSGVRDLVRALISDGIRKVLLNLRKWNTLTAQGWVNWCVRSQACAARAAN